jgi:hypothetical protein
VTCLDVPQRRAVRGLIVSLVAGVLVLIDGIIVYTNTDLIQSVFNSVELLGLDTITLSAIAIVCSVLIFIGAFLSFIFRKEKLGSTLVLIPSIISLVSGGGFIFGTILGIIGGTLYLLRK